MRLRQFINEEYEDQEVIDKRSKASRKKSKEFLKKGLRKLDDAIDAFVEEVEEEIDKIEENPSLKQKMSLMLANMEKEQGEFLIALRQVVHSLGKGVIPQIRGHAKGMVPDANPENDDSEDVRDEDNKPKPKEEKEEKK